MSTKKTDEKYIVRFGDLYAKNFEINLPNGSTCSFTTQKEEAERMSFAGAVGFIEWELRGKVITNDAGMCSPAKITIEMIKVEK